MRGFLAFFLLIGSGLNAAKIAVATIVVGEKYRQAVYPGIVNKRAYCKEHGYDFIEMTELIDRTRHPSWNKIKLLEDVLPKYDWVLWTDADSLIMNPSIRIEEIVDHRYALVICEQIDGMLNAGQFLIRNSPESLKLLHEVYQPELSNSIFWEQGAIIQVLAKNPELNRSVKRLHQRAMNSIWAKHWNYGPLKADYHKGDFILHFMGTNSLEQLTAYMTGWFEYLLQHESELRCSRPECLHRAP